MEKISLNPLASGNKTASAGILATLIGFAATIGLTLDLPSQYPWWDKSLQVAMAFNSFLGATGIGHKAWKWLQRRKVVATFLEEVEDTPQ